MKKAHRNSLLSYLVELAVYAGLVAVYFLAVLHFLGGWLYGLFEGDRRLYAVLALLLIIGQGFLLEAVTRLLLGWIRLRLEEP